MRSWSLADILERLLSNRIINIIFNTVLMVLIIFFIILSYIMFPKGENNIYSEYIRPYPNEVMDVTFWELYYTDMKLQGFQAYEEGNYNFAIEMFGKHLDIMWDDGIVRFYAAESYMVLRKPKKAIQQYNLALKSGAETFTSVIEWHKVVCYLMFNESAPELKSILEKIIENDNHPYHNPARDVYHKIFS